MLICKFKPLSKQFNKLQTTKLEGSMASFGLSSKQPSKAPWMWHTHTQTCYKKTSTLTLCWSVKVKATYSCHCPQYISFLLTQHAQFMSHIYTYSADTVHTHTHILQSSNLKGSSTFWSALFLGQQLPSFPFVTLTNRNCSHRVNSLSLQ